MIEFSQISAQEGKKQFVTQAEDQNFCDETNIGFQNFWREGKLT